MSGSFDPYHAWLGIPITEQPPHHYRLLGVPAFEANGMVISLAADRQIGFLESVNDTEHGFLAEQLIKSIDAARVCLLDAQRKSTYDAKLRSKLSPVEPSLEAASVPATIAPVITTANTIAPDRKTSHVLSNGSNDSPVARVPSTLSVPKPLTPPAPVVAVLGEVEPEPLGATTDTDWAPVPAWMEDSPPGAKPNASPPSAIPRPATATVPPNASRPPAPRPPSRTNESSPPDTDTSSDAGDSLSFLASPGMKSSPATEAVGASRPKPGVSSADTSAKSRSAVGTSKGNAAAGGKAVAGKRGKNNAVPGKPTNNSGRMMAIFLPTGIFIVALMVIIYFMFFNGGDKNKSKTAPKPGTTTSPGGTTPKKSAK